jgi:hypothetical protein
VDAVFTPEQTVTEVAAEMSADLDLNPKWLNNAARAFMPNGPDIEAPTLELAKNLALTVASPRYLLAMKLAAGRDRDIPDIAVLCQVLGIDTAGEAADIAFKLYGEDSMQLSNRDDVLLIAQEALDSIGR